MTIDQIIDQASNNIGIIAMKSARITNIDKDQMKR